MKRILLLFLFVLFLLASCNSGPYSTSDGTNYSKEQQQMQYDRDTSQAMDDAYWNDRYEEYKRQENTDRIEFSHPDGPDE